MFPNNPSIHGFKNSLNSDKSTTTITTTSFTCGKKPPTGIHPHAQNTFQTSGFWTPGLSQHKHEKVKNVKRILKSPETVSSSVVSATSKDSMANQLDVSKFNREKHSNHDVKRVPTYSKEISSERQNMPNKNISTDNKSTTNFITIKINESSHEGSNHVANRVSDNFNNSNRIQHKKHLLQTPADVYSKSVSPFHKLNYCRKTNLNQTKTNKSNVFEVSKVLENKTESSADKEDESETSNRGSYLRSRDDVPNDTPERKNEHDREKSNSGNIHSNNINESNFMDIPQLKTRAGSLTESIRPNENEEEFEGSGKRMRGLSLSASCLPFKPFQLQKPNLPWNRISSVSATNSMDRRLVHNNHDHHQQQRESFKNYVHVNIRTEKTTTTANHAKKRLESSFRVEDVRHSLPVLWKTGVFPTKDENSCDGFSNSAESLHSASTKCSIPSIQISSFDSTEDINRSVNHTPVESPACRSSSSESIRAHTPIPDGQERIPSSSSSPPPPPIPPRNKSLYQNSTACNKYTNAIISEIQIDKQNEQSIQTEVKENDQSINDQSINNHHCNSPQLVYDFKPRRESQDYVVARMKHEKSRDNHETANSHQPAAITLRSNKSDDSPTRQENGNNSGENKNSDPPDAKSKPSGKKVPENLRLSSKSLAPEVAHEALPSPDEKLKNFVVPCLWFSSTPQDRLLISILDPRNSELNKASCWENYMRLLHPLSPDCSSSMKSFSYESTSFSSLNNSTDSSSGNSSKFSHPQSPVSPFFRSKFSTFIPEEQIVEGSQADDVSNNTIVDSVHAIVSNYHDLESKIRNLLSATTDIRTQERFSVLLQQMDTSLQLIAKLTDQMTKLSSDSNAMKDHVRQNRLIEKLAEARDLKMNIDRKGEKLAAKIKPNIDQKSFEMLEFLLRARTYVMLLNRSNFISARRKASNPSVLLSAN